MIQNEQEDLFLSKRLAKYDKWLDGEKIQFSSKVIPINESLDSVKWVIPTEQVLDILRNARSFALAECECRKHYQRCNGPLEVCFIFNEIGEGMVERGQARQVDFAEAENILRKANDNGLIHLSLYRPDHEVYALCSCCPCCCHDLQIIKNYSRYDLMVQSEYLSQNDHDKCSNCGQCVDRCYFDARVSIDGQMQYKLMKCYGCGLCVTVCPDLAISMKPADDLIAPHALDVSGGCTD